MRLHRSSTLPYSAARIVMAAVLLTALTACGYKGPLYMPAPPPAPDASLTTPPSPSQPLTDTTDGAAPAKTSAIK